MNPKLSSPSRAWSRRSLLLSAASTAALAACGGGSAVGDPPPPGTIEAFDADRSSYFVGERARLTARFRGGAGSIEPGIGAVASGVEVQTAPLDVSTRFDLVVAGAGTVPVMRSITVPVGYRDRQQLQPSPYVGSGHAAVALKDGGVLLIGGSRGAGAFSEAIERFDPATGRVTRIGALSDGRWMAEAIQLPDGRVFVAGGLTGMHDSRAVDLIDPRTGQAERRGALSVSRHYAGAVLMADGRVLFTGGVAGGEGNPLGISRSAEIWDPVSGTFRRLAAQMAMPRMSHRLTRLADDKILVTGGFSVASDGTSGYVFAEIYDPSEETFRPLESPVRHVVANHAALALPGGDALVLGGEDWDGAISRPRAEVWRYRAAARTFEAAPPLTQPRALVTAAGLRDGRVLIFGGQTEAPAHTASGELYDAAQGGKAVAALDSQRSGHSVTRLADGRVLIAGGETHEGAYAPTLLVYE